MHDYPMADHPGKMKMYTTMRRFYYWPHLSIDVKAYITACCKLRAERVTMYTSHREMKLFPAVGPLEFVKMDVLGLLLTSTKENQFIFVICDPF